MTRARNIWKRAQTETVLSYAGAGLLLIVTAIVLGKGIQHHLAAIEHWINSMGPWAFVVFALLYITLSSLFVPDTILGIAAGSTFGFPAGLTVASVGTLIGSMLQYALARRVLTAAVDRTLADRPVLAALQAAVHRQELRLQVLIRLTPLNRALSSYLLGAGGVGFGTFVVACGALLPHLCLEVYFGYTGSHLITSFSHPTTATLLHDVALVSGLVIAVTVMAVISKMAHRAVEEATAESGAPPKAQTLDDV